MNELESILNEFLRYRTLAEKTLSRLDEDALNHVFVAETNSIAMLVRHLGGNLRSRFTNFLTEDGEKPWRNRDDEFAERRYGREEVESVWREGWKSLDDTLADLSLHDLERTVTVRGVSLSVHEALARSSAHVAYHVGQIVLLGRLLTAPGQWESLSIPRDGSTAYNSDPTREKRP